MITHRPVTSSDLKQERLFFFFRGSVSTFLQLVVAFSPFKPVSYRGPCKDRGWVGVGGGDDIKANQMNIDL